MIRRKKLVAIVISVLIGTMSCMTVMAASNCPECDYLSDMYTVTGTAEIDDSVRVCTHGKSGYDIYAAYYEIREYHCPDCKSWEEWVQVGWYWRCEGY